MIYLLMKSTLWLGFMSLVSLPALLHIVTKFFIKVSSCVVTAVHSFLDSLSFIYC